MNEFIALKSPQQDRMMAITAVPESSVASGQLLFAKGSTATPNVSPVALALERRLPSGTSSSTPPLVAVFGPPWPRHKQHASVHSCRKRFASSLGIEQSERPVFPAGGLRTRSAVCSAAYGSSNGNGRPGRGGYSPRPLTEDLNISKEQTSDSSSSSSSDQGIELSEAGERRGRITRGRPTGSRSPEAQEEKSSSSSSSSGNAAEKQQTGEDPYRIMDNGQKVYLDELDVVTLLEPPPFLRPMKTLYYNHAAFLWKKIGDIPEERRHRLLDLLLPRHISKMWELSKLRYEDPDVSVEHPDDILSISSSSETSKSVLWDGRATNVPWYYLPFSRFQKVFFVGNDEKTYGRVILGKNKFLRPVTDRLAPLYFQVLQVDSVMATEEQCDFALVYGEGQLHLRDSIPAGFAQPGKHVAPFNDNACDYLRAVGPGVLVGQTWIEGTQLEQFPRKWLGEFILVRRFR